MTTRVIVILACGLGAGLTGCAPSHDVSLMSIAANPTPELLTLNERPDDVMAHTAYTHNVNWRMFWEDLGRTWYTDHPSRLNPSEIPYVSGKPR